MVNQQLLDYIAQQLQAGIKKNDIRDTLRSQGWQEEDLNRAFITLSNPSQIYPTPSLSQQLKTNTTIKHRLLLIGNSLRTHKKIIISSCLLLCIAFSSLIALKMFYTPKNSGVSQNNAELGMYLVNAGHNASYNTKGLHTIPSLLWKYHVADPSIPIIHNDIVYFGSDDYFYAVDITKNKEIWKFKTSTGNIESSPAYLNGRVYFSDDNGIFYSLDALTGKEKWKFKTKTIESSIQENTARSILPAWYFGLFRASPTIYDGEIFFYGYDGKGFALNAVTGKQIWVFNAKESDGSDPLVSNGIVYFGKEAVDEKTGKQKFILQNDATVIANGIIYQYDKEQVPTGLTALNEKNRSKLWTAEIGGVVTLPIVVNNTVYVFGQLNYENFKIYLFALDEKTGKEKWRYKVNGNPTGFDAQPIIADNTIYFNVYPVDNRKSKSDIFTPEDSYLYAVNINTGEEEWALNFNNIFLKLPGIGTYTQPYLVNELTIQNGILFVGTGGYIVALKDSGVRGSHSKDNVIYPTPSQNRSVVTPIVSSADLIEGIMRANLQRTGSYLTQEITQIHRVKWKFKTEGGIDSTPVIANNTIYFGSTDNYFYAVDIATGDQKWKYKVPYGNPRSSPTVSDGIVYFSDDRGISHALSTDNGKELWSLNTNIAKKDLAVNSASSSPLVFNSIVYVGGADGFVYAIDSHSGKVIWKFQTGGEVDSSAAIDDGILFIGSSDGYLYAFNAKSGQKVWLYGTNREITAIPTIHNGMVYFGTNCGCSDHEDAFYALDEGTGQLKWKLDEKWTIGGSAAVFNTLVYFITSDGTVHAVDSMNGKEQWVFNVPDIMYTQYTSPIVAGNSVYFYGVDGYLYSLDAHKGSLIFRYNDGDIDSLSFSTPIISNGTLYINSGMDLYALD